MPVFSPQNVIRPFHKPVTDTQPNPKYWYSYVNLTEDPGKAICDQMHNDFKEIFYPLDQKLTIEVIARQWSAIANHSNPLLKAFALNFGPSSSMDNDTNIPSFNYVMFLGRSAYLCY